MIKKIIACLTICFIITGILSPVFSNASALPQPNWSDPGISEIINISDLTGWMLNGGTYDVSTYTDAESFMNDYFNARTQTRLVSPGEAQEDYYEVLPGFGINNQLVAGESFARPLETNRVIASSFRDHTGYGRRFSNEVNNALLSSGSLYDTKIPLLNEIEFANFVGFNHDALKLYTKSFNSESIEPKPDPYYVHYLNIINGPLTDPSDFNCDFLTGKNVQSISGSYQPSLTPKPIGNGTKWTTHYNGNNFMNLPFGCRIGVASDVMDININSTLLNVSYSQVHYVDIGITPYPGVVCDGFEALNYNQSLNCINSQQFMWVDTPEIFVQTSGFSNLEDIFIYLAQTFKHVNIYVDGDPWAIVEEHDIENLTPEFPDAIGGEELENTTWPIFRPRAPYYTNVPGILQAIEDAIADDGKLDIDDLKPYLTDENGDPVPDPIFDPEPVPIPVPDPVNPDIVPGLPILPAMPPELPGFSGVSVLAEIINFTNQSLPNSLIVTFWGIVFGIVILGLIKILHK